MKYPQLVSMPSAVSDWLEEQLEARGIDAVVYTRYVLSLLHTHTVDVIYSDEDLPFSHLNKEVRGTGGNKKRFRRTSDWWRYADAEQLKRSAAVKCLMSASDQNCEIESLVDELCEKLKEIKNDVPTPTVPTNSNELQQISPQELAEKYYAAFPPLSRSTSSPANLFSLIPKWIQSPKKKNNRRTVNKSNSETKLRSKVESDGMNMNDRNSSRGFNYYRNRKDFGICRNFIKTVELTDNIKNNWDLYNFNNNGSKNLKMCSSMVMKNSPIGTVPGSYIVEDVNNEEEEEEIDNYDDLPVDIMELLESPSPTHEVEIMNRANMLDKGTLGFSSWEPIPDLHECDRDFQEAPLRTTMPLYERRPTNPEHPEEYRTTFWDMRRIEHDSELSDFVEYGTPKRPPLETFTYYEAPLYVPPPKRSFGRVQIVKDPEHHLQHLTESSKFAPIKHEYADGVSFNVNSDLNKVNYSHSPNGSMYMDTGTIDRKKYSAYELDGAIRFKEDTFVLKYHVRANDQAIQTDFSEEKNEIGKLSLAHMLSASKGLTTTVEPVCGSPWKGGVFGAPWQTEDAPFDRSQEDPYNWVRQVPDVESTGLLDQLLEAEKGFCSQCRVGSESLWDLPKNTPTDMHLDNGSISEIWMKKDDNKLCQNCRMNRGHTTAKSQLRPPDETGWDEVDELLKSTIAEIHSLQHEICTTPPLLAHNGQPEEYQLFLTPGSTSLLQEAVFSSSKNFGHDTTKPFSAISMRLPSFTSSL